LDAVYPKNLETFARCFTSGQLRVERGYVRREDEPLVHAPGDGDASDETGEDAPEGEAGAPDVQRTAITAADGVTEPEEDEGFRPLSDKLLTELTAYRTLALREAVGNDPGIAYLAALHVLCLKLFYRYALDSCLEIDGKSVMFGNQAPGLGDTALAARVDARHRNWAEQLPDDPGALWDALAAFDSDSREALFAHCVSLTVNAVHEAFNRRPKAHAHATRLAEIMSLDMVATGWTPTVDNYLGRVTKARIIEAVREAKGEQAAQSIDHLKKGDMAAEAERLLEGSGWLPEPLRTPGSGAATAEKASEDQIGAVPATYDTNESADVPVAQQDDPDRQPIAAE
jgi:ParB family chromosome partitioning protein